MDREEMIDILIQDRIGDWVHAQNCDGLEEILYSGWEGFEHYTNEELEDEIKELVEDNFDDEIADKIRKKKEQLELYRIKKLKYSIDNLLDAVQKSFEGKEVKDISEDEKS